MSEQTTPAPAYPEDPQAPYFEHLYKVAQTLKPGITREECLALIRDADPGDTLRISEPWSPDVEQEPCPCGAPDCHWPSDRQAQGGGA